MAVARSTSRSCASGGVIAAGRRRLGVLSSTLSAMPAATWLNWTASTNVVPITDTGPDGLTAWLESTGNYYMTNWPGKATFDPITKQVLLAGTAQGFTSDVPAGLHAKIVFLDVTTGLFSCVWNPYNANTAHIYDSNPSVAISGKSYRLPFASTWLYETTLSSRVSIAKKDTASLGLTGVISLECFPEMGATGSVIFVDATGKVCRYDIATDALSTIGTYSGISSYPVIHHCNDYVVFGAGSTSSTLYKLTSAGVVTQLSNTLPASLSGVGASLGHTMVADPAGLKKSWLFVSGGNAYTVDHQAATWEDKGLIPFSSANTAVSSVQGTGAFVFLVGGGRADSTHSNSKVWLYKE